MFSRNLAWAWAHSCYRFLLRDRLLKLATFLNQRSRWKWEALTSKLLLTDPDWWFTGTGGSWWRIVWGLKVSSKSKVTVQGVLDTLVRSKSSIGYAHWHSGQSRNLGVILQCLGCLGCTLQFPSALDQWICASSSNSSHIIEIWFLQGFLCSLPDWMCGGIFCKFNMLLQ